MYVRTGELQKAMPGEGATCLEKDGKYSRTVNDNVGSELILSQPCQVVASSQSRRKKDVVPYVWDGLICPERAQARANKTTEATSAKSLRIDLIIYPRIPRLFNAIVFRDRGRGFRTVLRALYYSNHPQWHQVGSKSSRPRGLKAQSF